MNSVAVNIQLDLSLFFGYILRSGISGSYSNSIFCFLRNLSTVLYSGCTTNIPTNSVGGFPFLHTLFTFVIHILFNDGHSDWCEVIPHCSFKKSVFFKHALPGYSTMQQRVRTTKLYHSASKIIKINHCFGGCDRDTCSP